MRRACLAVAALGLACGCGHAATATQAGPAHAETHSNPSAIEKMLQGVAEAKEGRADHAAALLREATSLDPSLWEARYDLGIVLAGAGDLADAEDPLAAAAHAAPDEASVAVALAEVRRRRGEQKLAAEGIADFVRDHPGEVAARTLYVAVLRESGQIDRAITEAREVLVRKPADASALAELALAHLARGEKEAAALLVKQATDASPNSAVAHRATGLLDLSNGDDAAAFAEFRKAAQIDPHDTTSRLNMGVVLLRAGAYAKAEEQYREILRVSPDDADAQVGLAAALRGESDAQHPQRLDEAREVLDKVLAADPHETSALFNLGVLYADFLKKPAEAMPLFKRFLADAPGDHPLRARAEKYLTATSANVASEGATGGEAAAGLKSTTPAPPPTSNHRSDSSPAPRPRK